MAKTSILLVEDEQIVALDIKNSLENAGYAVEGHTDRGEDAIQKAQQLKPNLVLMDIGLKGQMDGIEAGTQIRAKYDIPVIFLTAFANQSTLERACLAEPYGYLLKPFGEQELNIAIEMALYKHSMEQKLRESENKFRGVIEHASDGIVLADDQGKIIEWNPAMQQITGVKPDEVIGQPLAEVIFSFLPPENKTADMWKENTHAWQTHIENGYSSISKGDEKEIETPQGFRRTIQSNGFTLEVNRRVMAGVIMRDITERKQNERLAQARLRLVEFAAHHSLADLLQKALDEVCVLAESPIGFYHFVEPDQQTLSLQAWSTRTLQEYCQAEAKELHYNVADAGVWVECIHQRKPVIHNDYAALPATMRKGLPQGHAQLTRELVVPILREGLIVAILGVGNKGQDYTQKDVEIVTFFADTAWELVRRKQAEDVLLVKDNAIASSISAIAISDIAGHLNYVNAAFVDMWGYDTQADILGKHVFDFWTSEPETQKVVAAVQSRGNWTGEMCAIKRDGSNFDVQVSAHLIKHQDGQPNGMMASFVDITTRKQAEVREASRRAMLEKVIELGKIVTRVTDFQECLRAIYTSVQKGLGFDRVGVFLYDPTLGVVREVLGTNHAGEMVDRSMDPKAIYDDSDWLDAVNNEKGFRYFSDYQDFPDNISKPFMDNVKENAVVSTWAGDQPVGFIAVDNVISGRLFNPEQLDALKLFAGYAGLAIQNTHHNQTVEQRVAERTSELRLVNQELEMLSYTIGHDLRSPIRALAAYSHMLQEELSDKLEAGQKARLQQINQVSLRMGRMVDEFLTFLRLSRSILKLDAVDFEVIARQVTLELQKLAIGREIEFSIHAMPASTADRVLIKNVYSRLISNAITFTNSRSPAKIEIGAYEKDGNVVYFVGDNGVGFDMEYAHKLFGVFQRLHHDDEFEGIGLGLAIVRRIIERHGGRIWAEAELDKGAKFFFTLS